MGRFVQEPKNGIISIALRLRILSLGLTFEEAFWPVFADCRFTTEFFSRVFQLSSCCRPSSRPTFCCHTSPRPTCTYFLAGERDLLIDDNVSFSGRLRRLRPAACGSQYNN